MACTICGKEGHNKKTCPREFDPLICEICMKKFATEREYNRHREVCPIEQWPIVEEEIEYHDLRLSKYDWACYDCSKPVKFTMKICPHCGAKFGPIE